MAATATHRLDMCQNPQQTAEVNSCHVLLCYGEKGFITMWAKSAALNKSDYKYITLCEIILKIFKYKCFWVTNYWVLTCLRGFIRDVDREEGAPGGSLDEDGGGRGGEGRGERHRQQVVAAQHVSENWTLYCWTECVNSSVARFARKFLWMFPRPVGHTTAAVQPDKKKNARRT